MTGPKTQTRRSFHTAAHFFVLSLYYSSVALLAVVVLVEEGPYDVVDELVLEVEHVDREGHNEGDKAEQGRACRILSARFLAELFPFLLSSCQLYLPFLTTPRSRRSRPGSGRAAPRPRRRTCSCSRYCACRAARSVRQSSRSCSTKMK